MVQVARIAGQLLQDNLQRELADLAFDTDLLVVKRDNTLGINPDLFFSISKFNLLEETYAISIPEKKADNKRLKIIIIYFLFAYFFLKCLLNKAIKTDSIQNPRKI